MARSPVAPRFSRRRMLGSAALAGAALAGWPLRARSQQAPAEGVPAAAEGLVPRGAPLEPVWLPPPGSRDIQLWSRSENLYWTRIMVEHTVFLARFLSGPELVNYKARAMQYQQMFAGHLARVQSTTSGFAALNAPTAALIRGLVDFKHELRDGAESGRIRSLALPSFYAHVAFEGERAVRRLGTLARGDVGLDRAEVIGFWSQAMGDHAKLIAHWLDPVETQLIDRALQLSGRHDAIEKQHPELPDALIALVEETIDFKAAAEKGIAAGTVRSAISPMLASHVRREAIKGADELRRVGVVHATAGTDGP